MNVAIARANNTPALSSAITPNTAGKRFHGCLRATVKTLFFAFFSPVACWNLSVHNAEYRENWTMLHPANWTTKLIPRPR